MEIVSVSPHSVQHYWPEVKGMLRRADLAHRFSLGKLEDDLIAGNKRLWVVLSGERAIAAIVSVITSFPTQRVCTILLCGGEDVDSWVNQVLNRIEEYARWEDCGQVEIIGRPGWRRKCAAYDHAGEWLVKELT